MYTYSYLLYLYIVVMASRRHMLASAIIVLLAIGIIIGVLGPVQTSTAHAESVQIQFVEPMETEQLLPSNLLSTFSSQELPPGCRPERVRQVTYGPGPECPHGSVPERGSWVPPHYQRPNPFEPHGPIEV